MRRRALLAGLAALRVPWAQTATFPGDDAETLRAIAGVVLPAEVDADRVTADFVRWVRGWRAGAEMDHGYGNTRIRVKGPSPAPAYLKQLAELRGKVEAASIEVALRGVGELPRTPGAAHVAADLMAFYFRSSDANDLCYRAAIGRDQCRGLAGSDQPPAPLKGRA